MHFPLPLFVAAALLALVAASPVFAQDTFPSHQVGRVPTEVLSSEVKQAAWSAVRGSDGIGKDGPLAKVGMELAVLYYQHNRAGTAGIQAIQEARMKRVVSKKGDGSRGQRLSHLPVSADGRFVTVDAVSSDRPSQLLSALRDLGLRDGAVAGNVASGRLPIASVADAAELTSLRGMMASHARTQVGSVESEADTSHRALDARLTRGVDGRGQKICALSDSYDNAANPTDASGNTQDASADVSEGDLPGEGNPEGNTTPVEILDDSFEGNGADLTPTDEGRAMLQLIHDIAPGATLGFHTAFGGLANFANGIQELADAGCAIIVDDVRYFAEPFYQDGPVSNSISDVVSNDEVAYFSSAGNDGQNSYEAAFRNSGEPGVINSSSVAHDFDSSTLNTDTRQEITVEDGGTFRVTSFQWTDPSAHVQGSSGADTDYDIALVDENDNVVAQSADDNISSGVPFETMEYTNDTGGTQSLFLVIEKAAGSDDNRIKYIYNRPAAGNFEINEYDVSGPTIYGHPMAEEALAVAAAPFYNTAEYNPNADPAALEPFSSLGGIPILFDQDGEETDVTREKPDVTAADGIDNTFFGSDIDDGFFDGVDGDPHPNFFGTSAAAPNIAAIAGLIREARPDLTPAQIYTRLEENSEDVTTRQNSEGGFVSVASGRDPWSGEGFVQAEPAVPTVTVAITEASAEGEVTGDQEGTINLSWRQIGGGEDVTLDAFVIKQNYFGGTFAERVRVESNGAGEYSEVIENLPVGTHRFRIQGVTQSSTGADSLVTEGTAQATLRNSEISVAAYPNPFRDQVRLSVTFPEPRDNERPVRVDVFDVMGRRVATPILRREIGDAESINLSGQLPASLGSGVYFFRVWNENFKANTRAVRVR